MNRPQQVVLALGGLLLAGNFLFPYTRYPVRAEGPGKLSMTQEHGLIPLWQTLAAQRGEPLFDHPSGYPAVQWRVVLFVGVAIVVVTGWLVERLGRRATPSQAPPQASEHA